MNGTILTAQRAPCEKAIRHSAIPTNVRALGPPRGRHNCPVFAHCIVHRRALKPQMRDQKTEVAASTDSRAAQTGVFDLDIRISYLLFIDVCTSCAAETGLKSRNVEKRIKAV
jgi:hypothetical protein